MFGMTIGWLPSRGWLAKLWIQQVSSVSPFQQNSAKSVADAAKLEVLSRMMLRLSSVLDQSELLNAVSRLLDRSRTLVLAAADPPAVFGVVVENLFNCTLALQDRPFDQAVLGRLKDIAGQFEAPIGSWIRQETRGAQWRAYAATHDIR